MFACIALLCLASPAPASLPSSAPAALPGSGRTPAQLLEAVQKSFNAATDFSAEFRHTTIMATTKKARSESGKLFIKKPGLVRWDYEEPTVKYFVIDGERLWAYKPEDAQVIVNDKFKDAEISAGLSFLWTQKKLADSFEPRHFTGPDPQGEPVAGDAIKLLPKKPDPNVKDIVFYLSKTGFIDKAFATDYLGNINVLELRSVKTNQGLKKEAFLFVPPDGVKVMHVEQ